MSSLEPTTPASAGRRKASEPDPDRPAAPGSADGAARLRGQSRGCRRAGAARHPGDHRDRRRRDLPVRRPPAGTPPGRRAGPLRPGLQEPAPHSARLQQRLGHAAAEPVEPARLPDRERRPEPLRAAAHRRAGQDADGALPAAAHRQYAGRQPHPHLDRSQALCRPRGGSARSTRPRSRRHHRKRPRPGPTGGALRVVRPLRYRSRIARAATGRPTR